MRPDPSPALDAGYAAVGQEGVWISLGRYRLTASPDRHGIPAVAATGVPPQAARRSDRNVAASAAARRGGCRAEPPGW
ncbi:hypothetical protein GCM10017772_09850 [Promicromonospora soli]|uniref:Uncharacterized protein n=1 Tax=Promicromonospora soli TaxID=2035533 RepID=A0A919FLG2_9MICO|nr:hypothetical protein GCM10017772_09850 [Promicromonospora soli]